MKLHDHTAATTTDRFKQLIEDTDTVFHQTYGKIMNGQDNLHPLHTELCEDLSELKETLKSGDLAMMERTLWGYTIPTAPTANA